MKSFTQIQESISSHKDRLQNNFKVKKIGIFGSFVREEQTQESDLDILVELSEPIGFFSFLDLEEELGTITGEKVDLVSRKALKPYIGERILEEVVFI